MKYFYLNLLATQVTAPPRSLNIKICQSDKKTRKSAGWSGWRLNVEKKPSDVVATEPSWQGIMTTSHQDLIQFLPNIHLRLHLRWAFTYINHPFIKHFLMMEIIMEIHKIVLASISFNNLSKESFLSFTFNKCSYFSL